MPILDGFYERPTVLSAATGHTRIFAQAAYRSVRECAFVPVVLSEVERLARLFPLCWRIGTGVAAFGALRSLLDDGRGHPPDAAPLEPLLPLVLQAFPIIVPGEEDVARQQLLFDATIADDPRDVGAPLLMPEGHLSRAAMGRAQKAIAIARVMADVEALSRDLLAAGLLEPWPLNFDLGQGREVAIDDLMVLSAARLDEDELAGIVAAHGALAGLALSLHRASLYRIGTLLGAARRAVADGSGAPAGAMSPA
jgi:hypothetical protein